MSDRIAQIFVAIAFVVGVLIGLRGGSQAASIENYGGEGQTCYTNQTCDGDLVCRSDLCVQDIRQDDE